MKNLIITLCLTFAFTATYSQDKSCATKLETMNWLASKMKEYLHETNTFYSYSGGIFKFKMPMYDGSKSVGYDIVAIDLNKITSYQFSISKESAKGGKVYSFQGKGVQFSGSYNQEDRYIGSQSSNIIEIKSDKVINFDIEEGLRYKVLQALRCLVQYN